MFPPSGPEAAQACRLCGGALAATLAAAEAGKAKPAPGSRVQPSADLPLAIRGVAVDKFVDDELLWLVHSIRKQRLRTGGGCERIQIVDLGESAWLAGLLSCQPESAAALGWPSGCSKPVWLGGCSRLVPAVCWPGCRFVVRHHGRAPLHEPQAACSAALSPANPQAPRAPPRRLRLRHAPLAPALLLQRRLVRCRPALCAGGEGGPAGGRGR